MTKKIQTLTDFVSDKASDMEKINITLNESPLVNTASGFSPVTETGLITNVWKELDTVLRNISTFANNTKSLISKYIVEFEQNDQEGADSAGKISTPSVSSTSGSEDSSTSGETTKPTATSELEPSVVEAFELSLIHI